jgi:hypothetical protein
MTAVEFAIVDASLEKDPDRLATLMLVDDRAEAAEIAAELVRRGLAVALRILPSRSVDVGSTKA